MPVSTRRPIDDTSYETDTLQLEDLPGFVPRSRNYTTMRIFHLPRRFVHVFLLFYLLFFLTRPTESCLPSWFRQARSADAQPLSGQEELSNDIGDPTETSTHETVVNETLKQLLVDQENIDKNEVKDVKDAANEEEYTDESYDYTQEEDDAESIRYNENAARNVTTTLSPEVRREIELLKEDKCRGYCYHNATCHVEVIFRDEQVHAVVPSCHCPAEWEGAQCDRHYVQAIYAPVSGRYQSSSAIPAFAFLFVMLAIFATLVVYAYRRMSRRDDEAMYTMSHVCPPDAFTVLKTPTGCKINVSATPSRFLGSVGQSGGTVFKRANAFRTVESTRSNSFFTILRSAKSRDLPRIDVSAINTSGHIDFSTISYREGEKASKAMRTNSPPRHISIEMEPVERRCTSRAEGEPSSPIGTTSQRLHDFDTT